MYPTYIYYPRWQAAPTWVARVVEVMADQRSVLDTSSNSHTSNQVLQLIRPALEDIGFEVESGNARADKIFRPVFFGDQGQAERQYEIDAYHPDDRIALEVEAGRSWQGNAIYRDIVQMSLLVDVDYAVVAVPVEYRFKSGGRETTNWAYRDCRSVLDAIYGGRRLELPFKGFLLIGY